MPVVAVVDVSDRFCELNEGVPEERLREGDFAADDVGLEEVAQVATIVVRVPEMGDAASLLPSAELEDAVVGAQDVMDADGVWDTVAHRWFLVNQRFDNKKLFILFAFPEAAVPFTSGADIVELNHGIVGRRCSRWRLRAG